MNGMRHYASDGVSAGLEWESMYVYGDLQHLRSREKLRIRQ